MRLIRKIVARLPRQWQSELKRLHFRRRISRGTFISEEPEFSLLSRIVAPGDWVVDVGANVGFYTLRLAELVGAQGRVVAFEPIPETFVQLANNLEKCRHFNVTLFNAAVSEKSGIAGMSIPKSADTGQKNFYEARLSAPADSDLQILTISLDAMDIPRPLKLIKIDAEGHEFSVVKGMRKTLLRDRPILIVETPDVEVSELLRTLAYESVTLPRSPNVVFHRNDVHWNDVVNR